MTNPVVVAKIDQEKLVVTQANRLIEASYTMSLEEKRIVLLMVSLVRKDDRDFQTYRIPITDIRDYLGLRTNKLYDDIKRVADTLMSRVLHIPEDVGGWLKVGWVSSARYVPKGQKGAEVACLDLCFSPEMKPYLLELKAHFAGYMLQSVAGLRSFYSIRLYELLKSRRRLNTTTFEVDNLRRMLRAEDKYRNHKDFRVRILLPAQAELAEKTDIAFDFREGRRGCKVTSITFDIRDNVPSKPPRSIAGAVPPVRPIPTVEQPPLLPPTEADREDARRYAEALAEGVQNGVRESVMRELLATRNPSHVLENIERVRARHMKTGNTGNLAGLTVAAITGDYAAEERAKRQAAEARKAERERAKAAQAEAEARDADAAEVFKRDLTSRLAALPAAEQGRLKAEFIREIVAGRHGSALAAAFRRRGWRAVDANFRMFAIGRLSSARLDMPA